MAHSGDRVLAKSVCGTQRKAFLFPTPFLLRFSVRSESGRMRFESDLCQTFAELKAMRKKHSGASYPAGIALTQESRRHESKKYKKRLTGISFMASVALLAQAGFSGEIREAHNTRPHNAPVPAAHHLTACWSENGLQR